MNPTPEQIRAMKAGPELDALVHEKWHPEDVIEWRWCCFLRGQFVDVSIVEPTKIMLKERGLEGAEVKYLPCMKAAQFSLPIPAYSTDGNAMLALLEKIREDTGQAIEIMISLDGVLVEFTNGIGWRNYDGEAKTLPLAVAIAASLAKGEEG